MYPSLVPTSSQVDLSGRGTGTYLSFSCLLHPLFQRDNPFSNFDRSFLSLPTITTPNPESPSVVRSTCELFGSGVFTFKI